MGVGLAYKKGDKEEVIGDSFLKPVILILTAVSSR